MLLAFVPARGGSKGIPRKNLTALAGKPLIQYTLEAALGSLRVDDVFLSTDDEEIASFCAPFGIDTRYRRPPELSTDEAPLMTAIERGLEWYAEAHGRMPDDVLVLQPTSPLRTAQDIDSAVERFHAEGADTLLGVHTMAEHPYECVTAEGTNWDYLVKPPPGVARRQDYEGKYYFINGALYLARTSFLLKHRTFAVPGSTLLHEMPRAHGVDVDSPIDIASAEAFLRFRQS
jgi:CMP-N,N'-diacetyllegionaminic acid synthase